MAKELPKLIVFARRTNTSYCRLSSKTTRKKFKECDFEMIAHQIKKIDEILESSKQ